jgi:hypothetical protein
MDSKIYIKNKLNEISEIFSELIFRYQFDKSSLTHIVEVKPLESYQSNEAYVQCEANFMFDFENEFFPETILFVSEDSLTQITEPEFTIRKEIFVSAPLKAKYSFELEKEELFCVVAEDNYAFAA